MVSLEKLDNLRARDPGIVCSSRTNDIFNALEDIWWSFPEWMHFHTTFARFRGVSIDGKFAANRFGLLLVTLSDRCNEVHLTLFAMAFLRAEDEDSVSKFIQGFLSTVPVCPKVVFTDASPSIICAVRKVLPESFILLNEWHLNRRQQPSVSSTVNSRSLAGSREHMGRELRRLRRSKNLFRFRMQRLRFEEKWFGSTLESLNSLRREHPFHFALLYLHSAAAEDMYKKEDFLFNVDDHTEINI